MTNIYSGLELALGMINEDYSTGERIASIILLSDGGETTGNVMVNFPKLIKEQNKENYIFTIHTFGYGISHDSELLMKISSLRDGGYFFVNYLETVREFYLQIIGSLSTTLYTNFLLTIQSNLELKKYTEWKKCIKLH